MTQPGHIINFPKFAQFNLQTSFNLKDKNDCDKLLNILMISYYRFIDWNNKLNKTMPHKPENCICNTKLYKCCCLENYMKKLLIWLNCRAITEGGGKYSNFNTNKIN
jgi:hypothetical protein